MNVLIIAVLFVAQLSTAHAKTCTECGTDYGTAKGVAGDNTAKCTAITDFLTCLSTATECPLDATNAGLIKSDHAAIASDCALNDVCTCQKTFFETDQNANAAAECSAVTAYFACLRGKTNTACDAATKVSGLAAAAENFIPTECTAKTDTCDCQIEFLKTDMDDATKKCTAAKNYVSCLVGKTDGGCDTSVDVKTLAGDAKAITDTDTCSTNDVCNCEITYVTADISTNEKKCTSTTAFETCLNGIDSTTETGCDDTSKTTDLKTKVKDLCSTAGPGLKSSIVISLITLIVSALFSSP